VEQPASIDVVYIFERFRLDRPARLLVRQDNRGKAAIVFLGSRAFDVLLVLVERSDEVVSKAQILDAVWPGLAVEEFNLTVQISGAPCHRPGTRRSEPHPDNQWPGLSLRRRGDARGHLATVQRPIVQRVVGG
jgi:hypothetical protein